MSNRNCRVWIAFTLCACLVLGAMSWLTHSVIRTERERAAAEIRAELQEYVRLSLWKMDSLGASILLAENSTPPARFLEARESPLPAIVRFETPDGAAIRGQGDAAALAKVGALLPSLFASLRQSGDKQVATAPSEDLPEQSLYTPGKLRGEPTAQEAVNKLERVSRERYLDKALAQNGMTENARDDAAGAKKTPGTAATPAGVEVPSPMGDFKAAWFEGCLFLVRRGMTRPSLAQGALVDDAALRETLLAEARQLLPRATLASSGEGGDDSFNLASFPFNLKPGGLGAVAQSFPRPIRASLIAGWLAAVLALVAARFLIANVMELSERRASFVSAVTHELRTPLTTFRLYSEILSTGAVREEKRAGYLNVLSREADRLSHLVENVLAFSKIERGSARSAVTEVRLDELLASFSERFSTRLEAAGLRLDISKTPPVKVALDASALEHILFNLIDNAAKYASASAPPVVTVSATAVGGAVEIHVSDHGAGIPDSERRRIFRPFHKSAKQAAETKPGVGLGLALSQRLARGMGGSLRCAKRSDGKNGSVFILSLPGACEAQSGC